MMKMFTTPDNGIGIVVGWDGNSTCNTNTLDIDTEFGSCAASPIKVAKNLSKLYLTDKH